MDESKVNHSSELLRLENPEATEEHHLASLLNVKNIKTSEKLKTEKLQTSSVLANVKRFLPDMKRANDDLAKAVNEQGANVDIESITDNVANVIEMDLALVQYDGSSDSSEESPSACSDSDVSDEEVDLPRDDVSEDLSAIPDCIIRPKNHGKLQ